MRLTPFERLKMWNYWRVGREMSVRSVILTILERKKVKNEPR